MRKERYQTKSASCKKKCGMKRSKLQPTLTIDQIKLGVAFELKCEGYDYIVFDRIVECNGRRIRVHVYCEDEFGSRLAVYCINKVAHMDPGAVFTIINSIRESIDDCEVALAFPVNMLRRASQIIGLAAKVFAVDEDDRVWIHYPFEDTRLTKVLREAFEEVGGDEDDKSISIIGSQTTRLRPFYIT